MSKQAMLCRIRCFKKSYEAYLRFKDITNRWNLGGIRMLSAMYESSSERNRWNRVLRGLSDNRSSGGWWLPAPIVRATQYMGVLLLFYDSNKCLDFAYRQIGLRDIRNAMVCTRNALCEEVNDSKSIESKREHGTVENSTGKHKRSMR
jgi:hypothetical protein